jgi:nucleoside-diphosphate-sugar epimerase
MPDNKKILITGATGFIGANLAHYFLRLGFDIHVFIRKDSHTWRIRGLLKKIKATRLDLLNARAVKNAVLKIRPAYIFHAASYGGNYLQIETKKMIAVNFIGTVNLITACGDLDYKLFVNTGSSSEYGIKSFPMKESDPLEPITDYGVSKAAGTLYAIGTAKREKRPIVTLRLFSPYGYYEGASRLVPTVIRAYLKGRDLKVSSSDSVRDFVFIEDVLSAYLKVTKNKQAAAGEIINIASGRQNTVGDVVRITARLLGSKVKPQWGSIENPRYEPKHWQADITKAKKLLGWQPMFNLEQGLIKTIRWYESL